jgi:aerobic-type carbon monoxide dehydrogenase small subunit (CoxS/CutS family)
LTVVQNITIRLSVNGVQHELTVPPRRLLIDLLRRDIGLTGTHAGCEHGVCGTCTVLVDGLSVRSCLMLAVQVDGSDILTVEGLAQADRLHPLQDSFRDAQGLQCGFCTPGMLLISYELLQLNPTPTEGEIREAVSANLCRCTGYQGIVEAVELAAARQAVTAGC